MLHHYIMHRTIEWCTITVSPRTAARVSAAHLVLLGRAEERRGPAQVRLVPAAALGDLHLPRLRGRGRGERHLQRDPVSGRHGSFFSEP